ncbi:MAG: hypothetical protein HC853_02155 [Anaerolineae bacterium]|nr:hypothetical protein [Anaerolineae bacterium]
MNKQTKSNVLVGPAAFHMRVLRNHAGKAIGMAVFVEVEGREITAFEYRMFEGRLIGDYVCVHKLYPQVRWNQLDIPLDDAKAIVRAAQPKGNCVGKQLPRA